MDKFLNDGHQIGPAIAKDPELLFPGDPFRLISRNIRSPFFQFGATDRKKHRISRIRAERFTLTDHRIRLEQILLMGSGVNIQAPVLLVRAAELLRPKTLVRVLDVIKGIDVLLVH